MSRSTGTFPHYTKLDIDPEKWPANYFNSSRFCELCEIHWPTSHLFSTCPVCREQTVIEQDGTPDMRWPEAVKTLLSKRFDEFYEEYNEGLTDEELAWEEIKKSEEFDFDQLEPASKAA